MQTSLAANYTKEGTNANVSKTIHPSIGWAAGGIVSNIPDSISFFEALLDGKFLHNRSLFIQSMTPIIKAEPDTKIHQYASFSLCLHQYDFNDITLLGHYGSFGFHSHMLYDSTLQLIYIDTSNSMNAEEGFEDIKNIVRYLRKLE